MMIDAIVINSGVPFLLPFSILVLINDLKRSERVDRKRTINDVDQKEWNHSSGPRFLQ